MALFAFSIWKGTSLPVFALGYFLLGGFRAARSLTMAQAHELVHDSQMGLTYGIMETISAVIFILTPRWPVFSLSGTPSAFIHWR